MTQPLSMNSDKKGTEHSFDLLILVVTLLLIFMMAARTPVDSDLWWHLRAGEETVRSHAPLITDLFSFTRYGSPWINHSWLSEVILYSVYHLSGFLGISLLIALTVSASMAFIYVQLEIPALLKAFLLIFGCLTAAPTWSPRPQTFSLLIFAIIIYLIYLYRWKNNNKLWLLLPISLLWSNLHGGFALEYIFIGAVILGELVNKALGIDRPEVMSTRKIWVLAGWTAASAAVLWINPNGLNIYLIPFKTVEVNALRQFISEWASPDFHDITQLPMLALLLGTGAVMALAGRKSDGVDIACFIVFSGLALYARRNFGPFALISLPIFSRQLLTVWEDLRQSDGWFNRGLMWVWNGIGKETLSADLPHTIQKFLNLIIVAVIGFAVVSKLVYVSHPVVVDSAVRSQFPAAAQEWAVANLPAGNLLNEYNWGGYLDWTLRNSPVFIDGRTDLFGDKIIGSWLEAVQAGPKWQEILDQWNIQWVMVFPNRPLVRALIDAGWKEAYSDKQAVILTR